MYGLGGAENVNSLKTIGFLSIFERVQGGQRTPTERTGIRPRPSPTVREGVGVILEALWGHFGSTLGSLWVYSNDSVSLYDHFGIIVESLWVYEGRFSKNIHFSSRF